MLTANCCSRRVLNADCSVDSEAPEGQKRVYFARLAQAGRPAQPKLRSINWVSCINKAEPGRVCVRTRKDQLFAVAPGFM